MASILVVDADTADRRLAAGALRELGHDVAESGTARNAIQALTVRPTDLTLLDRSLPDSDGIDALAEIKRIGMSNPLRVVMTSGRGRTEDLVAAFDSGADDFVGKPYAIQELVSRIDACLRRPAGRTPSLAISAGGIRIDQISHRAYVDGDPVALTPREYRLLNFLIENRDEVFSRQQLLTRVWEQNGHIGARTVDVHVRRLRSILEPYGCAGFVQTVRGSGYRFSTEP